MSLRGFLGALFGASLAFTCMWVLLWLVPIPFTRDTDWGDVACSTQMVIVSPLPPWVEKPRPTKCEGKVPAELADYSFLETARKFKNNDPLVCRLIQHNNWYFRLDVGLFNDRAYLYSNCQLGHKA